MRQKLEELERTALKQAAEAARRNTKIPFTTLKGSLPWPTSGPLVAKFGSPRISSALRRRGVIIGTQSGQNVYAVAKGRVIFANWLKGFGLLLIIDHSEGYLSLYGHNESLLKNVDDAVDQEEMIANTGNSGGQQNAGLYFELRHQGKPINPTQWFKKRG